MAVNGVGNQSRFWFLAPLSPFVSAHLCLCLPPLRLAAEESKVSTLLTFNRLGVD
jgi:hypothetical protein